MTPDPEPTSAASQPRHPIALVAERTGLSQDVLRMWERRYRAVQPTRSAGGQRLYSDADIERLRLLQAATEAGRRIGRIAKLATAELAKLVDEDAAAQRERMALAASPAREIDVALVDRIIARVRALDPRGVEDLLRRSAAVVGVPTFLERVAAPALRRVGDEWHSGALTIAQEHLASAVIGDLVSEMMRALARENDAPRLVVATLTGNRHIIGAALVGAAAAAEGWGVVYLGADVPVVDIARAAEATGARAVAVSVVYAESAEDTVGELRRLRERLPPTTELVVGGSALRDYGADLAEAGIEHGDSLDVLRRLLERTASRRSA